MRRFAKVNAKKLLAKERRRRRVRWNKETQLIEKARAEMFGTSVIHGSRC